MFLRKLFSPGNKFTWVLIDLAIVIIGVYCAFLIQSYSKTAQNRKEKEHVLSALKLEMEFFRYRMYETSLGMAAKSNELIAVQNEGDYANFSDFRFIEPQYDYQTIQYALNLENPDIVDFELYNVLQSLFVEIKKIEHVERLITETSRQYKSLPAALKKGSVPYEIIRSENHDNFQRFVRLIRDRQSISSRIASASSESLPIVNERLGKSKSMELERQMILENIGAVPNEDAAVKITQKLFPHFTEKELRKLYQQAKKK